MSDYRALFRDLQHEVWKVSFLNAFLNAALTFFVCNIIFTLIKVSFLWSVFPAGIVFLWSFVRKIRQYTLKRIEEGNPEVAEILRTAHDNSSEDNLMIHALFLELMQKMETVTAGVFISPQRAIMKVSAIAVLAFIPLIITSFLPFLIIDNPLAGVGNNIRDVLAQGPLAPTQAIGDAGERDIYGDQDVINLGNERLDITATSSSGGVDFTNTEDANGNSFRNNDYPLDAQAEQTTAGTGGKGDESDLVNDYSCKTRGTC